MPSLALILLTFTALAIVTTAAKDRRPDHWDAKYIGKYGPWPSWKTEPKIESTVFDVTYYNDASAAKSPGYYFFTLSTFSLIGGSWGPLIYDNDFNLIYMAPYGGEVSAQDPHVCDFKGELGNHLCAGAAGARVRGSSKTSKLVFNNSYVQISREYGAAGNLGSPDGHEYNMLEGGKSLLQLVYESKKMDLTPYGGPENGWIRDGCLQEIDTITAEPLFQWCFLDHFPPWETYIFPFKNNVNFTSGIAGHGTEQSQWDFMHVNAADKNFEGDYIISGRHLDQIIKIAGNNNPHGVEPGTVLWRLGGKMGEFTTNEVLFSRQHHVRYIETTANETTISLFDNSWEGNNPPSHNASAGRIIKINNVTMEAQLVREYVHPNGQLSLAQGSMQIMPNKNVLVGWGANPQITEFKEDGTPIFHANVSRSEEIFNYRAYKQPWTGKPLWPPKIIGYSRTCRRTPDSPLIAYVSWNGATEVTSYRFRVTFEKKDGPWLLVGTFPKQGFETKVELMRGSLTKYLPIPQYISVDALDSAGSILGSAAARTFVPMDWASAQCNEKECFQPLQFDYDPVFSSIDSCGTSSVMSIAALVILFLSIESGAYISVFITQAAATRAARRGTRRKLTFASMKV